MSENNKFISLDEKTDLHHICAVQMSSNLVQSRSKCGANGVNATFALGLHGQNKILQSKDQKDSQASCASLNS